MLSVIVSSGLQTTNIRACNQFQAHKTFRIVIHSVFLDAFWFKTLTNALKNDKPKKCKIAPHDDALKHYA